MSNTKKLWYSNTENAGTLTRAKVTAEIRRITKMKAPVTDKMTQVRTLIDRYFKAGCNEDFLNANLPVN